MMNDITFFNWSNNPWRGTADGVWRIPGNCYSSATYTILKKSSPLPVRPKRAVWQNMNGYYNPALTGDATGTVALQLCATGAQDPVKNSDPENCPSFAMIKEVVFTGKMSTINHRWDDLTEGEIDKLMGVVFSGGLNMIVRHKSSDGTTAPVWYTSRLLVDMG